jgi:hypothetical protein
VTAGRFLLVILRRLDDGGYNLPKSVSESVGCHDGHDMSDARPIVFRERGQFRIMEE